MSDDHSNRLLQEIGEQPACLARLLHEFPGSLDHIRFPGFFTQKLIGIGEGSSYNALKIAAPYIEEFSGINNFTFDPESLENKFEIGQTLGHGIKRLFEHSYFLTVSQSGQTASILKVIQQLQDDFGYSDTYMPMLTITNNPEGTLCKKYANPFELHAGEEQSIAATKSMTASILALLLFGLRYGQKRSWIRRSAFQRVLSQLQGIPEKLETYFSTLEHHHQIERFIQPLCKSNQFVLLSKGPLSLILPEVGLKLTETSRNIVWTDNTESFKHGRKVILYGVKGIRPNCLYLVPPDLSPTAAAHFYSDIYAHFYAHDEKIFSTEGVHFTRFENSPPIPDDLKKALNISEKDILTLPACHGIESLFLGIMANQMMCYYLAIAKGEDPNHPALQKAVTR